jgi:hypothetical protein
MTTIKKFTIAFLYVAILSQLTLVSCNDDKLTEEEKQQLWEHYRDHYQRLLCRV